MKELLIQVSLDNENQQLNKSVKTKGFTDDLEKTLLIISILESLKIDQIIKLSSIKR